MKLEMGESLFFSWLRHVKSCQVVQLNWKPSTGTWNRYAEGEKAMEALMVEASELFKNRYEASLFGKNSFEQLIRQAEVDVLGICFEQIDVGLQTGSSIYAIDVAFHEGGLNYGSAEKTAARVIKKYIRTAICVYLYLGYTSGEIIFASPKIHPSFLVRLNPYIEDCQTLLRKYGLGFKLRLLANNDFRVTVLEPIVRTIPSIADTSELFVRSIQMYNLFQRGLSLDDLSPQTLANAIPEPSNSLVETKTVRDRFSVASLDEMKIGVLVKTELRKLLKEDTVSQEEIEKMQTSDYSKETFGIQFPLLRPVQPGEKKPSRYWADPITTHGRDYYICSEWYETTNNNDRPLFMDWLKNFISP
ncbi:MAG: hypothetical protein KME14_02390 [Tildeniella torsiva UHER 1998/13D]|jgi:hypothetical protein|nr:hypothetical protein [Tildeniella torsiva UHER 1998/13D]